MKQRISATQLQELSDKGRERLKEWWESEGGEGATQIKLYVEILGASPLLRIGEMIEFLEEQPGGWVLLVGTKGVASLDGDTLCDMLWSACKEVLEKNNGE